MRTETYNINFESLFDGIRKHSPLHLLALSEDQQIKLFLNTQSFPIEVVSMFTSGDLFINELRNANHQNFVTYIENLKKLPIEERLDYYKQIADSIKTALLIYKITQKFQLKTGALSINVGEKQNIEKFEHTRTLLLELMVEIQILSDDTDTEPNLEAQTAIQKIAFMESLGILDLIKEKCIYDNAPPTYNYSNAAKIIKVFTGINQDSIRKALIALAKPNNTDNKRNNPFTNLNNLEFVNTLNRKFKLKKFLINGDSPV